MNISDPLGRLRNCARCHTTVTEAPADEPIDVSGLRVIVEDGIIVGCVCEGCLTAEEHITAAVNATLTDLVTEDGRLHRRPRTDLPE